MALDETRFENPAQHHSQFKGEEEEEEEEISNIHTLRISDQIPTANTSVESSQPLNSNQSSQSHFPIQNLTRTSISEASARSEEELLEPDAATALADLRPTNTNMDLQPSGHRRRRSSMMSSLDTNQRVTRTKRSPRSSTIGEDLKPGDRGSDDDSKSTSDDMELNNFSEGDLQDDEETGLTAKSKAKRKKKKIRQQSMDHRIAGDVKTTLDEKKEADWNVVKKSLMNGVLIGLWYIFSLSISIVSSPFHHPRTFLTFI